MKLQLILFRHAQAEDVGPDGSDHGRRLTAHGTEQAAKTAKHLAKAHYQPDLVLVSDAARTLGTWEHAEPWLGTKNDVKVKVRNLHQIYSDGVSELCKLIGKQDGREHPVIMLIGHNPNISELASVLSGRDLRFSKGQAVVMNLDSDSWAEAVYDTGDWKVDAQFGGKH